MKAFLNKEGDVVGIYGNEPHAPRGLTEVLLIPGEPIPQLGWHYDSKTKKFIEPEKISVQVPTELAEVKEAACRVIDEQAALVRAKYIGTVPDQLTIYTAKYHDAKAYMLKVYGSEASAYRWVSAEMSATGCSADEAANRFITRYEAMLDPLAKVEETRIFAKSSIRLAGELEEVRQLRIDALTSLKELMQ